MAHVLGTDICGMLPENAAVAWVYRTAGFISVGCYIGFLAVVKFKHLARTTLMTIVLCLCTSDALVVLWEFVSCSSSVHLICLDTCDIFLPVLRTFQMASILWTTVISIAVARLLGGRSVPGRRCMIGVPLAAVLLCWPHWAMAFNGQYHNGRDSQPMSNSCEPAFDWPGIVFSSYVGVATLVILLCYLYSVRRLWKLSSRTVALRKLSRVLCYVLVFCLCYAPYAIVQGVSHRVLCRLERKSSLYQVAYAMYILTGAANVASYGYHHWDETCWRRQRQAVSRRQGLQVVTFNEQLQDTICVQKSVLESVAEEAQAFGA